MEATVVLLLTAVVAAQAIVAAAAVAAAAVAAAAVAAAVVVTAAVVALVLTAESRNSRSHNRRHPGVDNRMCVVNCLLLGRKHSQNRQQTTKSSTSRRECLAFEFRGFTVRIHWQYNLATTGNITTSMVQREKLFSFLLLSRLLPLCAHSS